MGEEPIEHVNSRLALWRRAISLFDKEGGFEGPFHAAGYANIALEPELDDGLNPDVVGASDNLYVIAELSISDNKELAEVMAYDSSEPTTELALRLGIPPSPDSGAAPFFITNTEREGPIPDLLNIFNVNTPSLDHEGEIADQGLLDCLNDWVGFPAPPPNYSLLALPETPLTRVKEAMAGIIRAPASTGGEISPEEVCQHLLGDLYDSFEAGGKTELRRKVRKLLKRVDHYLEGYSTWIEGEDLLRFEEASESGSRKAVKRRLLEWLQSPSISAEFWNQDSTEQRDEGGPDYDQLFDPEEYLPID